MVHSEHLSGDSHLEVDTKWISKLWVALAERGESIIAQVHTHPGEAFHSRTDDAYPIAGTPGFVSIVVPHFAALGPDVGSLYATMISKSGSWSELDPTLAVRIV